jgi:membrane-associated phospholipid phosphatase
VTVHLQERAGSGNVTCHVRLSRAAVTTAITVCLLVAPAVAQTAAPSPATRDDGRRTIAAFVPNFFRGASGIFSAESLVPLLVGGGVTAIAAPFDDDAIERFGNPDASFGKALEKAGSAGVLGGIVAALFVAGRATDAPRFRATTYDLTEAALVAGGYTQLLKAAVRRERPDGSNDKSFPSGHASSTFALAAVAEEHYGWKAGVPAYTLAAFVAASRVQREKHFPTDVIAGATLGYVVGRAVVRVNDKPLDPAGATHVSVAPVVTRRDRGLVISLTFR